MNHEKITWSQVEDLIVELEIQIKQNRKKYDWIIGINRGGLIPSVLMSHRLGANHAVYTVQSYTGTEKRELKADLYLSMIGFIHSHHNILVVDDIADSGESLNVGVKKIRQKDSDAKNIDTATLHYKPKSIFKPTFYGKQVENDTWIQYPWEVY